MFKYKQFDTDQFFMIDTNLWIKYLKLRDIFFANFNKTDLYEIKLAIENQIQYE